MNVETLMAAMPGLGRARAEECARFNDQAMVEFSITSVDRAQHWLAQTGHESVSLTYFEEIASGEAYNGRQDLGNTQPGDGPRFKGRGPIQITGRANYTAAAAALGLDLVNNPQIAAQPDVAFRVSGWWWATHGCNEIADGGAAAVEPLTRRINGGLNGLDDRASRYQRCAQLGAAVIPEGTAPKPPRTEDIVMVSDTVQSKDNVIHVFQASKGRALWHKWSLDDGAEWRNEPLIGPGSPDFPVQANADSVSAQVIGDWLYVASDDNESGAAWMSRQDTSGGWDIRQLP